MAGYALSSPAASCRSLLPPPRRARPRLMEVVCGSLPCARTLDTSPTTLNVTDMGVVEVPFGAEPAAAVRKFISHSVK